MYIELKDFIGICVLCGEKFNKKNMVKLNCGHKLHKECWFKYEDNCCPICGDLEESDYSSSESEGEKSLSFLSGFLVF